MIEVFLTRNSQRLAEQLYVTDYEATNELNKAGKPDDDELKEAVFYRLESLGYRVGLGLAERCTQLPTLEKTTKH